MASLAELSLNEVPIPANVASAVDQDECVQSEASLRAQSPIQILLTG